MSEWYSLLAHSIQCDNYVIALIRYEKYDTS